MLHNASYAPFVPKGSRSAPHMRHYAKWPPAHPWPAKVQRSRRLRVPALPACCAASLPCRFGKASRLRAGCWLRLRSRSRRALAVLALMKSKSGLAGKSKNAAKKKKPLTKTIKVPPNPAAQVCKCHVRRSSLTKSASLRVRTLFFASEYSWRKEKRSGALQSRNADGKMCVVISHSELCDHNPGLITLWARRGALPQPTLCG